MEGYQWGGEEGKCRKKVRRIRSIIGRYKIDQEDVKNSIRNGEAKKLICMARGHELRGWGGYRVEGGKGGKLGTTVIA